MYDTGLPLARQLRAAQREIITLHQESGAPSHRLRRIHDRALQDELAGRPMPSDTRVQVGPDTHTETI